MGCIRLYYVTQVGLWVGKMAKFFQAIFMKPREQRGGEVKKINNSRSVALKEQGYCKPIIIKSGVSVHGIIYSKKILQLFNESGNTSSTLS